MSPDDPGAEVRELGGSPLIVPEAQPLTSPTTGNGHPAAPNAAHQLDDARRRRLRPWAIAGAAVVAIVTGSVALSYTPVFEAREVEVEGEERLAPRRVMRLAGIGPGVNVVHLDAARAEARLETEPWILDATVQTRLPSTITITVREREPVLVLVDGGTRSLVAADGTVLGRAPWSASLALVSLAPDVEPSPALLGGAGEVVQAMAPLLRIRVDTVTVFDDGSVDLVVDGDVRVRYGAVVETTAKAQSLRAILAYADEQGRGLLEVDVSAPAAPTARFVGSQQPSSVPDPSADAESSGDDVSAGPTVSASP